MGRAVQQIAREKKYKRWRTEQPNPDAPVTVRWVAPRKADATTDTPVTWKPARPPGRGGSSA